MTVVYENQLKPFFRVSWTSAQAAGVWAPRMAKIKHILGKVRPLLVRAQAIGFYQDTIYGHQEEDVMSRLKDNELDYFSLHNNDSCLQSLVHNSITNDEACYTYFAGKAETVEQIKESIQSNNKKALFELSGMTPCCGKAYASFLESGYHDPITWLVVNSQRFPAETSAKAGRLLLAPVFEIPLAPLFVCASECDYAEERWPKIMHQLKQTAPKEAAWLEQILDWPMHWSALHGSAEIKTPVAKIIYRTDATSDKVEISFKGQTYPEEGARGLAFPYRK